MSIKSTKGTSYKKKKAFNNLVIELDEIKYLAPTIILAR